MKVIRITKDVTEKSYKLFDPSKLKVGDLVSHDIYVKRSSSYIIIVEVNTTLSEKLYKLLQKHENFYVEDQTFEDVYLSENEEDTIDCNTLLTRIKHNKHNFSKTLKLLYEANNQIFNAFLANDDNKIDLGCIDAVVESVIFLIQKNNNYLKKVIMNLHNDYKLPTHSFNVMLYTLHIGNSINLNDEQLLKLGQAALLHDIGKKMIDPIIHKDSKLDLEELELTKQHAGFSVDILKQNAINDSKIIDAVEHHHERCDGSGYPHSLKSGEISNFASIIGISDVFDALTIDRPHRKKYSTFEALKLMMKDPDMKDTFNNEYVRLLLV